MLIVAGGRETLHLTFIRAYSHYKDLASGINCMRLNEYDIEIRTTSIV